MHAATLLAFVGLAFAAPAAHATQVILQEDFESGLDGWGVTPGGWHIEVDTDLCGSLIAPFPVGNTAAYYGGTVWCDYSGSGGGGLTRVDPIHIPAGQLATLRFVGYEDAECESCSNDNRRAMVFTDAFPLGEEVWADGPLQVWHEQVVDISAYAGQDIRIGFQFSTGDHIANDFLGWMIDDVRVELHEAPEAYCQTSPNSAGAGAEIGWTGSTLIADNNFILQVSGVPSAELGIFYYGPTAVTAPFGNGTRCVGGGATGTVRLNPPGFLGQAGSMERQVDFTTGPAASGSSMIVPGSEWFFQCWYRDPVGAGHNLSDGLRVPFAL